MTTLLAIRHNSVDICSSVLKMLIHALFEQKPKQLKTMFSVH